MYTTDNFSEQLSEITGSKEDSILIEELRDLRTGNTAHDLLILRGLDAEMKHIDKKISKRNTAVTKLLGKYSSGMMPIGVENQIRYTVDNIEKLEHKRESLASKYDRIIRD